MQKFRLDSIWFDSMKEPFIEFEFDDEKIVLKNSIKATENQLLSILCIGVREQQLK